MTWVKLDDRFFDNPKIAALSDAAKVAYLEATCYCARELTDGFVPLNKGNRFAGKARVAQELVPQLWELADGGYRVHDYLKYNPPREKVLAERAAAQRRMFGLRSGEQLANEDRSSDAPVKPVTPSYIPLSPEPSTTIPPVLANGDAQVPVIRAFEHCFGRPLSPMEIEGIKALDEEHPRDRIDYALREAADLNKRSVRYIQRVCENQSSGATASSSASTPRKSDLYDE